MNPDPHTDEIQSGSIYSVQLAGRKVQVCTVARSMINPGHWICEGLERGQRLLVPIEQILAADVLGKSDS